ncbi:hypothetical protein QKC54_gp0869 [Megavirus baoshan]|uniref:Uncharacterized protein n=1 Tax=Megavirus baoshan TaxID=2496520 RepID=A0A8K1W874_9VIRU|nr:hypothetical protein QKC54_gp0869 [Megavirus baoshan]UFX99762.1 hypothetical protein Mb0203 [Megavirus baoshan]
MDLKIILLMLIHQQFQIVEDFQIIVML